jgi:hypothetical protein
MTTLKEFRCEVCGLVTTNPIHRFVIRCGDSYSRPRLSVERSSTVRARSSKCGPCYQFGRLWNLSGVLHQGRFAVGVADSSTGGASCNFRLIFGQYWRIRFPPTFQPSSAA